MIFMTQKHKHSIHQLQHIILLRYQLLKNVHKSDIQKLTMCIRSMLIYKKVIFGIKNT